MQAEMSQAGDEPGRSEGLWRWCVMLGTGGVREDGGEREGHSRRGHGETRRETEDEGACLQKTTIFAISKTHLQFLFATRRNRGSAHLP